MREKFDSQEYRDNLAEEIKQEPDKEKRLEILEQARATEEYKTAKSGRRKSEISEKRDLVRRQDVDVTENIHENRDYLKDRFIIAVPDNLISELGDVPESRRNQEIMFKMRELFMQTETGREYAWIPQSLEACMRSLGLRNVRALEVDPSNGSLRVITNEGLIDETLEKLSDYSIELLLQEAEKGENLPVFNYSEEIQEAVGKLGPSARYRWELITRAAYQEFLGNNNTKKGKFNVRPVISDYLTLSREGIGVFSDKVEGFSLAKLTHEEVPVTAYESRTLWQADKIFHPETTNPLLKEFYGLVFDLSHDLGSIAKEQDRISRFIDKVAGIFGGGTAAGIEKEIGVLINDFFRHQRQCMKVRDNVKDEVYGAKGTFSEENPFELTDLSQGVRSELTEAADYYANLFAKLVALIESKKAFLLPLLQRGILSKKERRSGASTELEERTISRLAKFSPENIKLKLTNDLENK